MCYGHPDGASTHMKGKTNIMYLKIVFVTLVGVNNSDSFMVKNPNKVLNKLYNSDQYTAQIGLIIFFIMQSHQITAS